MTKQTLQSACFIIDAWFPIFGGGQVNVREMSLQLADRYGINVDIITRKLKGEKDDTDIEINHPRVRVIRLGPVSKFENSFMRIFFLVQAIMYLLFKKAYDLYLPQSVLPGVVGKLVAVLKHRPVILTIRGSVLVSKQFSQSSFKFWLEKMILTKIKYDKEISVAGNFKSIQNVNREIEIVPNGIDVTKFDAVKDSRTIPPELLFVGRFDRVKGIDYLIRAIEKLVRTSFPDIKLNLIGYGYEEHNLKKLTHELKLENTIIFPGKKKGRELLSYYKRATLFVLPSLSEGHPVTLLEAWAARLPVVVTDVGDNAQYVRNGENGYIVPAADVDAFADAIKTALNNADLEEMGAQGYQYVSNKLSNERTLLKTFEVYSNVYSSYNNK